MAQPKAQVTRGTSRSQYGRPPGSGAQTHVRIVPPTETNPGTELVQPYTFSGDICGQCWPDGWPEDTSAAGCIHGNWSSGLSIDVGDVVVTQGRELEQ
jgi:hypothetical protein